MRKRQKSLPEPVCTVLLRSQPTWQAVVRISSWMMRQRQPADLKSSALSVMSQDVLTTSYVDVPDVREIRVSPSSLFRWKMT